MRQGILKYALLAFMWIAYTLPAMADPNDPDAGDDPEPTPIDSWEGFLIIAAIAVGIYFATKYRNKQIA